MHDYPQLTFYLMVPFVAKFGPVEGVQKFTMFALLFLIVSCYLLFYRLSKNHGMAILLAVLVLLSPNIYGAATWAGSIPYFFAQVFFPLGLLAGVMYLEDPKARNLALMILATGLGFLINGFGILAFLVPSLYLIIIFSGLINRQPIVRIIKNFLLYNFGWVLAAFTVTFNHISGFISSGFLPALSSGSSSGSSAEAAAGSTQIAEFYRNQLSLLYTRTDQSLFIVCIVGAAIFIACAIFLKEKRKILFLFPILLISIWTALHPIINLGGIYSLLRHDPYRAFWQFEIGIGALAAFLWGYLFRTFEERFISKKSLIVIFVSVNFAVSITIALVTYSTFYKNVNQTTKIVEENSELSSAFPEALSIRYKTGELEKLKSELTPSFMDPNDRNTRLYVADATINIWWNLLFKMPLSRGYIDPPIGTQSRGGIFWLDIAIANNSLVRDFKLDEGTALNNALFLIDWNAIGFYEGGHLSSKGSSVPPSSYLVTNNVFDKQETVTTHGAVLKYQTAGGKPELVPDLPQNLNYYKVDDKYRSPVIYGTNTPAVVVISSDYGYEDLMRVLGSKNLNSRRIIPAHIVYIEDLTIDKLKDFDAVILHNYYYNDKKKAFDVLEKYVSGGGKVFIDTGAEVRESISKNLPEIFPFDASERESFGREWKLTGDSEFTRDLDFSKFGPLIFNDQAWKLTVPAGQLREGSKVLLSHDGKPILIERSIGRGKVIWSGINLSYHYNQYKSEDEAKMFIKILSSFTKLDDSIPLSGRATWNSPESVTIETDSVPRGIMFKEQAYEGWKAFLNGKRVSVYKTGPTFPGFMYVPLSGASQGPAKVEFSYSGKADYWVVGFVNLMAVLFALDFALFNGWSSRRILLAGRSLFGKRVVGWWQKEDE